MQILVEIGPSNASQWQHRRKDATEQMKNLTLARKKEKTLCIYIYICKYIYIYVYIYACVCTCESQYMSIKYNSLSSLDY